MRHNIAGQQYLTSLVCGVARGLMQGRYVVYRSVSDVKSFPVFFTVILMQYVKVCKFGQLIVMS